MKNAIISLSDKKNAEYIANFLLKNGYTIYSSGGTYNYLSENVENIESYKNKIINISTLTGFPEILDGRVKTLHPKIYGGILANRDLETHIETLNRLDIPVFQVVIVNLYPFEKNNTIENIDIGGVSLIRAAAKNYKFVSVLTDIEDYMSFIHNYENLEKINKKLALKAFKYTSNYDVLIYNFLSY